MYMHNIQLMYVCRMIGKNSRKISERKTEWTENILLKEWTKN